MVLDTCCGEGRALEMFKQEFSDITTYGAELDSNRYATSKKIVDHVLNCDSLTEIEATNNAFDVLWLNPPYDHDIQNEKALRLEKKFLQEHRRYLRENGLLVYIVPFFILGSVTTMLSRFNDVRVLAFPKDEYPVFKQVVVLARYAKNQPDSAQFKHNKSMLERIVETVPIERAYDYLETTESADYTYIVESGDVELKTFYTRRINPDDAFELVQRSNLHDRFERKITLKELNQIQPLFPLTEGHLAMLLAAGIMDGYVETPDGERLVVKGSVTSRDIEREDDDGKTIVTKAYDTIIKAVNLTSCEMMTISA
jgi:ubiquinone/menaquinone biosynthesis C-methylase UbiE